MSDLDRGMHTYGLQIDLTVLPSEVGRSPLTAPKNPRPTGRQVLAENAQEAGRSFSR